ncbi:MAG: FtsB family cell division protein [Methanococcaceae archaeon]
MQEHVAEIEKKNQKMKAEIDSLKFNDAKIEKVAREKYNMTRKGENAFRIEIK